MQQAGAVASNAWKSPYETMAIALGNDWIDLQKGSAPLTTNREADVLPFQRWYRFKEAFSPLFVRDAFRHASSLLGRDVETCLDPFGGSGTTSLTAQFLGVKPTTIEVNPFLADLIRTKLTTYDIGKVLDAHASLIAELSAASDMRPEAHSFFPGAPRTFVEPGFNERWIFDRPIARRLWSYRRALEQMADRECSRLFRILLGSILLSVSNVVVSGKGRRYRKSSRRSLATVTQLDERFQQALERAVEDIDRYSSRSCTKFSVLRGDARKLIPGVHECDLVLFSPPYPNSFDYTDIYNVELWTLGYLTAPRENTALRHSTLRSHVQINRDFTTVESESPTLLNTIRSLKSAHQELWNPHIPSMVSAYFEDIITVLRACRDKLTSGGVIMMVVGDSRYAGVHIDVPQIVRELMRREGLRCRTSREVRSMRVSAQQGGAYGLSETLLVISRASFSQR